MGRGRSGRNRTAASLGVCLAALLLATCPAAAPAAAPGKTPPRPSAAGQLDRSFGGAGKVAIAFPAETAGDVGVKYDLPFQFDAGELRMAQAPGGKIVVAGASRVVRLLASGKPDRGFGSGGSAAVPRPPGLTFVLAGVAVDSQGRVLLAGSARPLPVGSTPDPLLSSAMVVRLAADGSLDPSFGSGGVLVTDFGIGAPATNTGHYSGPAVGLRSIAVDSLDRPVLSGGSVTKVANCSGRETARSTALVARLTESGAPDLSFGSGGLRQVADFGSFEQGTLLSGGALLTVGNGKTRCDNEGGGPPVVLTGFGAEGNLNPGFGFAGFRAVGYESAPVATVAPSGKIVLLGAKGKQGSQLTLRLLPSGAADPGFGRTGRVRLIPPVHAAFAAVAVDARGRLLFAGRITKRVKRSRLPRSSFYVARMTAKGSVDRSFGRKGSVATGFGGPSSAFATQIALDAKGRILVGGGVSTPQLNTGGGFALARYLNQP